MPRFPHKCQWKIHLHTMAEKQISFDLSTATGAIHSHIWWSRLTSIRVYFHTSQKTAANEKKKGNIWLGWWSVTLAHSCTVGNPVTVFMSYSVDPQRLCSCSLTQVRGQVQLKKQQPRSWWEVICLGFFFFCFFRWTLELQVGFLCGLSKHNDTYSITIKKKQIWRISHIYYFRFGMQILVSDHEYSNVNKKIRCHIFKWAF